MSEPAQVEPVPQPPARKALKDFQMPVKLDSLDGAVESKQKTETLLRHDRPEIKNLLATELAMAVYSTKPEMKIRHVLEAFTVLSGDEQLNLFQDLRSIRQDYPEETVGRARRYFNMVYSISDVQKQEDQYGIIPFTFPVEKAGEYFGFVKMRYEIPGKEDPAVQTWQEYCEALYAHLTSGVAPFSFCIIIKANYIDTVMPFSLYILKKLFLSYLGAKEWENITAHLGGGEAGPRLG